MVILQRWTPKDVSCIDFSTDLFFFRIFKQKSKKRKSVGAEKLSTATATFSNLFPSLFLLNCSNLFGNGAVWSDQSINYVLLALACLLLSIQSRLPFFQEIFDE